jgi:hypothetical protein
MALSKYVEAYEASATLLGSVTIYRFVILPIRLLGCQASQGTWRFSIHPTGYVPSLQCADKGH